MLPLHAYKLNVKWGLIELQLIFQIVLQLRSHLLRGISLWSLDSVLKRNHDFQIIIT